MISVVAQVSLLLVGRSYKREQHFCATDVEVQRKTVLTSVVIPALVQSVNDARRLVDTIKMHALDNPGNDFVFGLLTDCADALAITDQADSDIIKTLCDGIDQLNGEICDPSRPRFCLFHRPRVWSHAQELWVGRERKRGKLEDFNNYVVTGDLSWVACVRGPVEFARQSRFVITLDEDNALEPGGARKLVDELTKHESRIEVNDSEKRVVAGHAILQPLPRLPNNYRPSTNYQALVALCWSDADRLELAYQIAFDAGSFVGKGIYIPSLFHNLLFRRFPDETILSHDVLEGCVLGSALSLSTTLTEKPLSTLKAEFERTHRWHRGDWQAFLYCLGTEQRRDYSLLSRWKLFDYARRATVPGSYFIIVAVGLVLGMPSRLLATIVLIRIALIVVGLLPPATEVFIGRTNAHGWLASLRRLLAELARECTYLAILPSTALNTTSACITACWRYFVSRKRLLEWKSATTASRESLAGASLSAHYWYFRANVFAVVGILFLIGRSGTTCFSSLMVCAVWLIGPGIAWYLSRPVV